MCSIRECYRNILWLYCFVLILKVLSFSCPSLLSALCILSFSVCLFFFRPIGISCSTYRYGLLVSRWFTKIHVLRQRKIYRQSWIESKPLRYSITENTAKRIKLENTFFLTWVNLNLNIYFSLIWKKFTEFLLGGRGILKHTIYTHCNAERNNIDYCGGMTERQPTRRGVWIGCRNRQKRR